MQTWTELAEQHLRSAGFPLADWLKPGLELQFMPIAEDDPDFERLAEPGAPRPFAKRVKTGFSREPKHQDGPIPYDPALINLIGWTGWDSAMQQTMFVGFDFDFGHGGTDLTAEQMELIKRSGAILSYVTVTTSKGALGVHWHVRLAKPIPTDTPEAHQRVADAILAQLSADLGFDLQPYVCKYGTVLYIWSCRTKPGGLQLVKAATADLTLPSDWQAMADTQREQDRYRGLDANQKRVLDAERVTNCNELGAEHRSIIDGMEQAGFAVFVDNSNGRTIIKLHTGGLAADHAANKRRGAFATTSPASKPEQPNAYGFLLPCGGLAVRRFGATSEAPCWHKGPSGVMCINYNVSPTLSEACELAGGTLDSRGDYTFDNGAAEALRQVGVDLQTPMQLQGRPQTVKRKGDTLYVFIQGNAAEKTWNIPGWKYYRGQWEHAIKAALPAATPRMYSDRIRLAVENKRKESWNYLDSEGIWICDDASGIKTYIKGHGHKDAEVAEIVKYHQLHNWRLTRVPFADEHPNPDERIWNRDGARLSCKPAPGICVYWRMILEHCGRGLDEAVRESEWCRQHGVFTGGDYLLWWIAILVRHPAWRLPYLFLFSEQQNTGKSSLHRAIRRLLEGERGAAEIRKELTKDDFNDALVGAVLCTVEEIDLSADYRIYDLVKNYIDSPTLKIRGMFRPGNEQLNYTHWIHTANSRNYCPVYPGDSRIIMVRVDPFELDDMPWLTDLQPKIDAECPAFLAMLHEVPLPKRGLGRLSLPVLETREKREAMAEREASMNDWFIQLRELASENELHAQTANQIHEKLCQRHAWADAKFPKTAAALAPALKRVESRLRSDGFVLNYTESTKHKPAVYSIDRI